jgi:hypothetical protein
MHSARVESAMIVEPITDVDIGLTPVVLLGICVTMFLLGVLVGFNIARKQARPVLNVTSERDEAKLDEQIVEMSRDYLRSCRRHKSG